MRKSLVNRILVLQLVWAIMVFVTIGIGLWWGAGLLIDQNMNRQAEHWSRDLDSLGTRLYVSRARTIPALVARMEEREEIRYVRYYRGNNSRVVYEYVRPGQKAPVDSAPDVSEIQKLAIPGSQKHPLLARELGELSITRYVSPVRIRRMKAGSVLDFDPDREIREQVKTIGYIEFGLNREYYISTLRNGIYAASLTIGVLFLLSIVLGRIVIMRALAPLSGLKDPLARLARGERDVVVEDSGDEEIDAITQALNATINAVRERDNSLRRMAEFDDLTGLVNRACFAAELEQEVAQMKHAPVSDALFFIDLDQFKYINDTLGHAAGDRLLKQVAQALKTRMRDSDLIARFGGDEFTVLARGVDEKNAVSLAGSLLSLLQDMRFVEGDTTLHVHCSIGLTLINSIEYSAQEYLAQADMACHQAKTGGRNRYVLYKESEGEQGKMLADMSWSQAILNAVQTDGFVLHFQPIVGDDNEGAENYEVLLRMTGEGDQLFAPGAFLTSAERFGLMPKIDNWVIRHSIARLAEMRKRGRNVRLFINLSGHIFKDTGTLAVIRNQLKKHDIPGDSICFEITEQVAVQHLEEAALLMRSLQKIGCQFALDDFGAGFSSLNYIKSLPIDYIKIDGSFIANMRRDPVDQAMVQSFVQIGHTLGKKTVAEYVENLETLVMLKKLGVDYVQGFFVGKPAADINERPLTLKKVRSQK